MDKTEIAREYLISNLLPRFSDKSFESYIKKDLAGDFAYQLAQVLQNQPREFIAGPYTLEWLNEDEIKITYQSAVMGSFRVKTVYIIDGGDLETILSFIRITIKRSEA